MLSICHKTVLPLHITTTCLIIYSIFYLKSGMCEKKIIFNICTFEKKNNRQVKKLTCVICQWHFWHQSRWYIMLNYTEMYKIIFVFRKCQELVCATPKYTLKNFACLFLLVDVPLTNYILLQQKNNKKILFYMNVVLLMEVCLQKFK